MPMKLNKRALEAVKMKETKSIRMIPNSISEKWTHFLYLICVFDIYSLMFDIISWLILVPPWLKVAILWHILARRWHKVARGGHIVASQNIGKYTYKTAFLAPNRGKVKK